MDITPRHRMILKALIEDFVLENKPIGSKTLCDRYSFGFSPATIRNVFQDLEELGYINSRHHSGGRVPTETGYRFYVDSLLSLYELTVKEKQRIQEEYLKNQLKMDQILKATCSILSILTNNASVVLAPEEDLDTLKHLELIHVSGDEVLAIIVTRAGTVLNRNFFLDQNISQEGLYRVSRFLNDHCKGYDLKEISLNILPALRLTDYGPAEFYQMTDNLSGIFKNAPSEDKLYIDGLKNLKMTLKDEDEGILENLLELLDDRKMLKDIFTQYIYTDGVVASIGERSMDRMFGVSIVATNYKMGEKKIGSIGVIGPQRMNYTRTLPLVEFTSKLVSEMMTKLSK